MRVGLVVVSVGTIIAAPLIVGWAITAANNLAYWQANFNQAPPTLNIGGTQVDNIFAYDAEGNPIERVQLFDQNGDPLNLTGTVTDADFWGVVDGSYVLPSEDVPGGQGWNVYPLDRVEQPDTDRPPTEWESERAWFPFDSVRPLSGTGTDSQADPLP